MDNRADVRRIFYIHITLNRDQFSRRVFFLTKKPHLRAMCGVLTSRKENHLNFNKLRTIFYHETEICLIIKVSSEIYKSHERERLVWSTAWGQFDISASSGLARARDTVSCPLTISLGSTVI